MLLLWTNGGLDCAGIPEKGGRRKALGMNLPFLYSYQSMKRKTMITISTTAAMTPPPIPPPEGPEEYPEERNLRRVRAPMKCIGAMIAASRRCEYLVKGTVLAIGAKEGDGGFSFH